MRRFHVIDAEQRSTAWFAARSGRITGSKAAAILATIKTGEAAARRDYRTQLVCERLTGIPQDGDGFVSDAMQRGIDLEPAAFAAYEAMTGNVADRSGFLAMTAHLAGCSLDGHVGDYEGILEVKCPKSATHLGYIRDGKLPKEHEAQVRHNLWVTGAEFCDFLSFDDRFPDRLRTFYVRVLAKNLALEEYEREAMKFLAEVETEYRSLLPFSEQVA